MRHRSLLFVAIAIHFIALSVSADEKEKKLIEAARKGDLPTVKQLVAGGIDVNATLAFNITALWQASSKGHREVVKFLLQSKADPNVRDGVWHVTPLILAEDVGIVTLLVKHGARDVDVKLRSAAQRGSENLVRAIIDAKPIDKRVLAAAKAQAELGSHKEIVLLLDEVAGQQLPGPPQVAEEKLKAYAGKYLSERLEEVEVSVVNGHLSLNRFGSTMRLIARDDRTFDFGPSTFTFQLRDGEVVGIAQSSGSFRERIYTRAASTKDAEHPGVGKTDDWMRDNKIAAKSVWPSFRGKAARGIAVGQNLPEQWNAEKGEGVCWKTPIPGLGNSCPVVWEDKVFVTTAVSSTGNMKLRIGLYGAGDAANDRSTHSWQLYCLDHSTGRILWHRVAHEGVPPVKRHMKSSQANSTPATNGKHVVALFNSGGLYCYDMDGELLWKKDLGVLDSGAFNDADYQWGFGSSPIIYGNTVIVQCDLQTDSFLAAFEINSGKQVWRVPRDELPSWGTPTIYETARGPLLIANATNFVRGYDARTGNLLWKLDGNAAITVPTPIVGHDLIFVTSGYRPIQPIYAVRLDAAGDISLDEKQDSNQYIAWSNPRGGPYLPTPILYGNYFYTCGNNGILTCYEAKTGKRIYRKRCGRGAATSFTASPVAADGKIYVTAEAGVVYAIKAGPDFEILSHHPIGEYSLSTPAIAGGRFLLRTQSHLIAIGAEKNGAE